MFFGTQCRLRTWYIGLQQEQSLGKYYIVPVGSN